MNKGLEADANSRLAQAGFYGNDTLGSSIRFGVPVINLCFKIPACAKRQNVASKIDTILRVN